MDYFLEWLAEGHSSEKIAFVVRNREQEALVRQRLWQSLERPVGPVRILRFRSLVHQLLQEHYALFWQQPPQLIGITETLMLLEIFHKQHSRVFRGAQVERFLFQRLFDRHQRRAENGLSWEELYQKCLPLDENRFLQTCDQFLQDYTAWLQGLSPPVLDYALALDYFGLLLAQPQIKKELQRRTACWLIDDIDEAIPVEQDFYELLWKNTPCIYTGNPWGGTRKYLGAHPEYLAQLRRKRSLRVIELESAPSLGEGVYDYILGGSEGIHSSPTASGISLEKDPTHMFEAMARQLENLACRSTAPENIVLVTWSVPESLAVELAALVEGVGWELDVFRGSQSLGSDPVVNALLSLVRLVLWDRLKKYPQIPKLSGYEMTQICTFCTQLDMFEIAELRFRSRNQLDQWGLHLRSLQSQAAVAHLLDQIQACREDYQTLRLPDLPALARRLWKELLWLSPLVAAQLNPLALQVFFTMLERYSALQPALPDQDMDMLFIYQMLAGDIAENPDLTLDLARPAVKLMTLQKLCELQWESDYQLWFDLKSPHWFRSDYHAVVNPHLISRGWPPGQPWTLAINERQGEEKLARALRKGLRYCRREPFFYACDFDSTGKPQRFNLLLEALQPQASYVRA